MLRYVVNSTKRNLYSFYPRTYTHKGNLQPIFEFRIFDVLLHTL